MIINRRHLPYKLPTDENWYSQQTQALCNSFPMWTKIRTDQTCVGHQFINSMGTALQELTSESIRAQMNKYLTTADMIEPDLVYKIVMQRAESVNVDDLHVEDASGVPITRVGTIEEFFTKLPTRLEYIDNDVAPSSYLTFNGSVNDPEELRVEYWEPDKTNPYTEIRGLLYKVESNTIQQIDRINPAEIYATYTIDYTKVDTDLSTGTIKDVAAFRNWLWALVENNENYYVVALNKYTEMPPPSSLYAYTVLEIPDASGTNLVGLDNDASGYFWTMTDASGYSQYKLCHDYFYVNKTAWILYLREPYEHGIIVT